MANLTCPCYDHCHSIKYYCQSMNGAAIIVKETIIIAIASANIFLIFIVMATIINVVMAPVIDVMTTIIYIFMTTVMATTIPIRIIFVVHYQKFSSPSYLASLLLFSSSPSSSINNRERSFQRTLLLSF